MISVVHRNRTIDFSTALPTEPPPLLPTNRCQLSVSARTPTRNETSQVLLNRPNRSSSISEIKPRPRPTSFQSASKQPPPRQMSLGTNRATPVGKQQKGKILFLWVHLQLLTSSLLGFLTTCNRCAHSTGPQPSVTQFGIWYPYASCINL